MAKTALTISHGKIATVEQACLLHTAGINKRKRGSIERDVERQVVDCLQPCTTEYTWKKKNGGIRNR